MMELVNFKGIKLTRLIACEIIDDGLVYERRAMFCLHTAIFCYYSHDNRRSNHKMSLV